jgi:hypothetical protein
VSGMYSKYAWQGRDMHARGWARSLKGSDHFVDLRVDSRMDLKEAG